MYDSYIVLNASTSAGSCIDVPINVGQRIFVTDGASHRQYSITLLAIRAERATLRISWQSDSSPAVAILSCPF